MSKGDLFMDIMPKFVENLNYLISEKEITCKRLSEEIGIREPTICRYRNGINTPSLTNFIKFADYFNCSVDYLIGIEEEKFNQNFKPCPPISERMAALPEVFKMSAYKFCRKVEIPETSFYEWKNGSSEPSIYSILKIAKHFEHSVDFILGRES